MFECGICATVHGPSEFDGKVVRVGDGTDQWVHEGKEGTVIGYCPVWVDYSVRLRDGTQVFTDVITLQ